MGYDTMDANLELGHQADEREYSVAAAILADLSLRHIRLLTNNPDKISQLTHHGIHVASRVPLLHDTWSVVTSSRPSTSGTGGTGRSGEGAGVVGELPLSDLARYLHTKARRMNHLYE